MLINLKELLKLHPCKHGLDRYRETVSGNQTVDVATLFDGENTTGDLAWLANHTMGPKTQAALCVDVAKHYFEEAKTSGCISEEDQALISQFLEDQKHASKGERLRYREALYRMKKRAEIDDEYRIYWIANVMAEVTYSNCYIFEQWEAIEEGKEGMGPYREILLNYFNQYEGLPDARLC